MKAELLKVLYGAAVLLILAVLGWLLQSNYAECRAHGFSELYCLTAK